MRVAETLVSAVIPTYNRHGSVWRAVESALTQTWRNVEVIVVDDGSTDETIQVLAERVPGDARVRLIKHKQRKGAQAARNLGIHVANGQWIAFLDSDDLWLPHSVELRLEHARRARVRVVHSECHVLEPGASEPQHFGVPSMQGRVFEELLRRPGPVFPGLLVRKDALAQIGYLDESVVSFQEWDTAIRLARRDQFAFVSEPTFVYDRRRDDSISRNPLRTARGYEQIFVKHRRSILRHLGPKALAGHYQTAAGFYRNAGNVDEAQRCLRAAFLLWPFRPKAILRHLQRFVALSSAEKGA